MSRDTELMAVESQIRAAIRDCVKTIQNSKLSISLLQSVGA
ncbi:hypothetical protein GXM_08252 [Nostoc sphaeroides CCNUC1]|uniref:Uncharacterized protein n=1 Tax=Nostoc sphaeroides CCNUC1 TaxID=2653204 RepID=A0A5P8WDD3_9NOSO|nr:hypothetical protein GXM_08252 [Nostoc sphaeroides CCNUC1]